jgi:hypothetical protein
VSARPLPGTRALPPGRSPDPAVFEARLEVGLRRLARPPLSQRLLRRPRACGHEQVASPSAEVRLDPRLDEYVSRFNWVDDPLSELALACGYYLLVWRGVLAPPEAIITYDWRVKESDRPILERQARFERHLRWEAARDGLRFRTFADNSNDCFHDFAWFLVRRNGRSYFKYLPMGAPTEDLRELLHAAHQRAYEIDYGNALWRARRRSIAVCNTLVPPYSTEMA